MGSQEAHRTRCLQVRLDRMNAEEQRLRTFSGWPISAGIDSARIARAGFFRTGRGLEVECFACRGRISDWRYGDIAMARHRELNPNCPFVLNPTESLNIPIAVPPSSPPAQLEQKGYFRNESSSIYNQGGPDYRKEEVRLASYSRGDGKRWPVPEKVSPAALAKAGFYWNPSNDTEAGLKDRVTCAFCDGSLGGWESGDDPESEHRRGLSTCPFVIGAPVGNVPIPTPPTGSSSPSSTAQQPTEVDKVEGSVQGLPRCATDQGKGGNQFGNERLVELISGENGVSLPGNQGAELLGVRRHRGPINVRFSTTEARIASFSTVSDERTFAVPNRYRGLSKNDPPGWPSSRIKQTPKALADAGFFYTGQADQVRCFHCDGGLWDWRDDDDPWIEHARWFPNCAYIMLVKGEAFVEAAKNLRPPTYPAYRNTSRSPISQGDASNSSSALPNIPVQNQTSHASSSSDLRSCVLSATVTPRTKVRNVTSEELDNMMGSTAVMMALEIGLDAGRVRNILQRKIEETGAPFSSPDDLVLEVLGMQREESAWSDHHSDSEEERGVFFRRSHRPRRSQENHAGPVLRDPEYYSDSDDDDDEEEEEERSAPRNADEDSSDEDDENGDWQSMIESLPLHDFVSDSNQQTETLPNDSSETSDSSPASPRDPHPHYSSGGEGIEDTEGSPTNASAAEAVDTRDCHEMQSDANQAKTSGNSATEQTHNLASGEAMTASKSGDGQNLTVAREELGNTSSGSETTNTESRGSRDNFSMQDSASSIAALEEENRRFRESRLCKVCLDEDVGVVFLPCGHLVSCIHCAPSLKDCPLCRRPIGATVRTYLS